MSKYIIFVSDMLVTLIMAHAKIITPSDENVWEIMCARKYVCT